MTDASTLIAALAIAAFIILLAAILIGASQEKGLPDPYKDQWGEP